jgi:two-component system, OmpR family, sensor kinase
MRTGSIRKRVMTVTLVLLLVVLAVVISAVTLAYQRRLQDDLRSRLEAAGSTVARSGSASTAAGLASGLALEGVATSINRSPQGSPAGKPAPLTPPPKKAGSQITTDGDLLKLTEVLPNGTRVIFSASGAQLDRSIQNLLGLELVAGLAALILAALLVWRGTRMALKPLTEVSETASAIASGDHSRRLRPDRTDTELGVMATAFDRMVDALDDAASIARRSEEGMQRFLADAAHELRTPIAALQATAEQLLREQPDRPERDEVEASLAASAARLGRLVADLLDLTRIESAGLPKDDLVELDTVARKVVAETVVDGPNQICLRVKPVSVVGDASGLARAIRNLVDNATAAVPPSGHVYLSVRQCQAGAKVTVTDDGPGIAPADRERIFERFTRLHPASGTGTGLGLAIARRIARQHGGDLTCDDVPPGLGGSFTLTIPHGPGQPG